jgi:serine/threonine protein kinase/tetratricopeptide (TPR) repeat protein
MGEVYEAEDRTLATRIALKVIRPETADNPQAEARFKREVQLAREVSHPNVCRLHDVGIHRSGGNEVLFLTMELLTGTSLRDLLVRDGPLSPVEALPIVEQMAAALDAAHAAGIIHRDFKSANVMVSAGGAEEKSRRVVVTDFGLARSFSGKQNLQSISDSGAVLGTPAYMAPEQVEGEHVTSAADVYAFGIVLYEMMTGFRPFDGGSPFSVAARRLNELPTPPSKHRPDLAPAWEQVILRCLSRKPEDRYATAGEAVRSIREGDRSEDETEVLDRADTAHSSEKQIRSSGNTSRFRWSRLGLVGALVFIVMGLVVAMAFLDLRAGGNSVTTRPTIAVLNFENLTGDSGVGWVSTALSELLTTEMGSVDNLRTLGGHEIARIQRDIGIGEEASSDNLIARLHRQLGADMVVSGSYSVVGSHDEGLLRVDLRLINAATGNVIEEGGATGTPTQLFELLERAAEPLRQAAGIGSISPSDALAIQASWPTDEAAARDFALGIEAIRRSDYDAARRQFEFAAEVDPSHPLIHAMLAKSLFNLGHMERARDSIEIAQHNSAGLPSALKRTIDASSAEIDGDLNRAIAIYQDLLEAHPDDFEIGLQLLFAQIDISDTRAAEVTLDRLRGIEGPGARDPRLDIASMEIARRKGNLDRALAAINTAIDSAQAADSKSILATARLRAAEILQQLGKIDEAEAQLTHAQELYNLIGNDRGRGESLEAAAQLAYQRGDLATAKRLQSRALEIYDRMSDSLGAARVNHNLGVVAIDRGDLEAAQALFDGSLKLYREIGAFANAAASELDIGVTLHLKGQLKPAENRYRSALDLYTRANDKAGTAMALTNIGEILFLRGDLEGSRQLHEEALAINTEIGGPSATAYDTYRLGMVFLAAGDLVVARSRLETAISHQEELGEGLAAALTRITLAEVELAEGRLLEAEALAQNSEERFRVEGAPDLAAMAEVTLAKIMLARGRNDEAAKHADWAVKAASSSGDQLLVYSAAIASHRAHGLVGHDVGGAVSSLDRVAEEAKAGGYTQIALEAGLAAAEAIRASGDLETAEKRLEPITLEARNHGLGLIEKRARDLSRATH